MILLNKSVQYVERLSRLSLIPEIATTEMLEVLDAYIENVWVCEKLVHDGRLNTSTQVMRLRGLPQNIIDEFSIDEAIKQMSGGTFSTPVRKAKNITVVKPHSSIAQTLPTIFSPDSSTNGLDGTKLFSPPSLESINGDDAPAF